MARIRTVKPEVFIHEELFDSEKETGLPLRLAYIGLWTQCDREGRFIWRPRQLKTDVLPYDDVDFSRVLDALWTRGFLVKYASQGNIYGCIPTWVRHQVINNREKESELPEPTLETRLTPENTEQYDASATREGRVKDAFPTRPSLSPSYSLSSSPSSSEKIQPREFEEQFWLLYPHKVGKRDAEKAFAAARKRHSLETILDGARRYAAKSDDRPWCNPATWLNQDRCLDQPAPASLGPPQRLSRTQIAANELLEDIRDGKFNGNGEPGIRGESGDDARLQLPKPSARAASVPKATHHPVHREAEIIAPGDDAPGDWPSVGVSVSHRRSG